MNGKPWTAIELELMRLHYADSLTADLARALDRHVDTVYATARRLGLRKSPEFLASAQAGRLDGHHYARRSDQATALASAPCVIPPMPASR